MAQTPIATASHRESMANFVTMLEKAGIGGNGGVPEEPLTLHR
ncbi:hypothetical protein ACFLWI_03140 [Chloroflexota bacterium]